MLCSLLRNNTIITFIFEKILINYKYIVIYLALWPIKRNFNSSKETNLYTDDDEEASPLIPIDINKSTLTHDSCLLFLTRINLPFLPVRVRTMRQRPCGHGDHGARVGHHHPGAGGAPLGHEGGPRDRVGPRCHAQAAPIPSDARCRTEGNELLWP